MGIVRKFNITNIILGSVFAILFILSYLNTGYTYEIGLVMRFIMAILSIINGIWLSFTEYKSFLYKTGEVTIKKRKVLGVILLVVGVATLITVFMGYGINNVYSK